MKTVQRTIISLCNLSGNHTLIDKAPIYVLMDVYTFQNDEVTHVRRNTSTDSTVGKTFNSSSYSQVPVAHTSPNKAGVYHKWG